MWSSGSFTYPANILEEDGEWPLLWTADWPTWALPTQTSPHFAGLALSLPAEA